MNFFKSVAYHFRIIGALMMRETTTRYGREGLGLLWLVGEPLIFVVGVIIMWSIIKPAYEHGIRVAPFVMTGYMCLLLLRHLIASNLTALQANVGLLYHRRIKILHIYMARCLLEFASNTVAFIVVYAALFVMGQIGLPSNLLLLYEGWLLLGWVAVGLALTFAALAIRFELFERIAPVLQYALIPLSGVFVMMAWLPEHYRDALLKVPIAHPVEMVRAGVFGEFVKTYYSPGYAMIWAAGLTFFGLIMLAQAKHHIEID